MKQTSIEWLEDAFFLNAEAFNGQWTINNRDIDRIIETAKDMEKKDTDNKVIHFAEWLTNKHTTILSTLYVQFEEEHYKNKL